ncbi:hypothetical protein INR49_017282 [Caranx melampygus]|nr:hypothetical protein INR49_017282 [Caranx melampygus]
MIGLNVRLFIIAKFQLEREPPSEERESKRSSVYLILVVAVFFLGTWLPIFTHVVACNFFGSTCYTFKNEGTDPLRILPRVNAALTPILYIRGCSALRATLFTKVWRPCYCILDDFAPLISLSARLNVKVESLLSGWMTSIFSFKSMTTQSS